MCEGESQRITSWCLFPATFKEERERETRTEGVSEIRKGEFACTPSIYGASGKVIEAKEVHYFILLPLLSSLSPNNIPEHEGHERVSG